MPFETPARTTSSMERVTLYVPRAVVAALNAHAKDLGVRVHDLVRQILAKSAGNPATDLDLAVDRLESRTQAPALVNADGSYSAEAVAGLTAEAVRQMPDDLIKAFYPESLKFKGVLSKEADDALFQRFEALPE